MEEEKIRNKTTGTTGKNQDGTPFAFLISDL